MNKKLLTNVLSVLLAGIAVIILVNFLLDSGDTDQVARTSGTPTPDWYWQTARFWRFDISGEISQEATATDVKHYEEDDTTYITDPRFTTHHGEGSPWFARADLGQMREDNNILELYQNVQITRGQREIVINTEKIVIDRDQNLAETDQPITIEGSKTRTEGVGMRAWLKQERVELLDKVRTVHDPR